MTNLRTTIARLANEFAAGVLDAIRSASLEEILLESTDPPSPSRGARAFAPARTAARKGRLGRRSAGDIGRLVEQIVALLDKHPEGLRAEQIREALSLEAKELPRPLAEALSARRISKAGQKRATTYFSRPGRGGTKGDDPARARPNAAPGPKRRGKGRGRPAAGLS